MPELFIIRGNRHTDTVTVYRFDEVTGEALCVGDFGDWGYCHYVPYENRIISSYGNQGYFYTTVTEIDADAHPKLADAILRNNNIRQESYYGFSMGDFTGAMPWDDYDINRFEEPGEAFRISEEEADRVEEKLQDGAVKVDTKTVCVNVAGE